MRARVRVRKGSTANRAEPSRESIRLESTLDTNPRHSLNETTIFLPLRLRPRFHLLLSSLSRAMPAPFTSHVPQHPLPALYLYPLNDSFIPKHIHLPQGQRIKIGRQTNAKTAPGERNGFFDSKVLSRQHAEVWEESGKVRTCSYPPALSLSPSSHSLDLYQRREELKRYLH